MEESEEPTPITNRLLNWYKEQKRDLPWRSTSEPYSIWISEVILQQTRIVQGWEYYSHFMRRFPNVQSLAEAEEEEVLKLWQGLGYYSRARNLHTAAKEIMDRFNGRFPTRYSDIRSLRGVGDYTAAAISSIAFNEPYPAIDGNANRVIARLFAVETPIHTSGGKKVVAEISDGLISHQYPGDYNQAIMDFGSLICTPTQPKCAECVLQDSCLAFLQKRVTDYPVKKKKKERRKRYFHYFYILHQNFTYIQIRHNEDIWKNLYEFPLIETSEPMDFRQLEQTDDFRSYFSGVPSLTIEHHLGIKHILTHQHIDAQFYLIIIPEEIPFEPPQKVIKIENEKLNEFPISRLTHKYLEAIMKL